MEYSNIENVVNGITKVLKLESVGSAPPIPTPIIYSGVPKRSGLSATRIANRIISRKGEAGLPVGVLPSGETNPDDIMIRITVEEIIRDILENLLITVAIPPGTTITASGVNGGGPVVVLGSTVNFTKGYGTAQ